MGQVGAGMGMSGAGEEGEADTVANHGHGHGHGHTHGHGHGHGHKHGLHCCKGMTAPMMKILGLDRFTKGKAVSGMRRAGQDQNPFDIGVIAVSLLLPIQHALSERRREISAQGQQFSHACLGRQVVRFDSELIVQNCNEFWTGSVDYTQIYDIPPGGEYCIRLSCRIFGPWQHGICRPKQLLAARKYSVLGVSPARSACWFAGIGMTQYRHSTRSTCQQSSIFSDLDAAFQSPCILYALKAYVKCR